MRGWDGDRELDLGPVRQQALLAFLAIRANQTVTADELFDAVWGDRPPGSGVKIIPPYIYRVRKVIPDQIVRTRDGYVLNLDRDALDLSRFESKVDAAKRASGDSAATLLANALAEWRGEPLAGLPGPGLVTTRHQLRERRLQVLAERIGLDLECSRHADALPELAALVDEHPLNERFAGLMVQALHRSGRQADALETYLKTRTMLVDQLGVEPGAELRAIHKTVLGSTPRDDLPRDIADFVGREVELDTLHQRLRSGASPIAVIDGMAGVGKTALAVRAARRLGSRYPGGRLFLDLHGHTPARRPTTAAAALDRLLRTIGVPAEEIPSDIEERTARWRAEVANRRLLLVLDNAASSRQIEPLLPGGPGCGVLVTSRRQLTGLDATYRVALDVLSPAEAASLLQAITGVKAAGQLVEACGRLPLALRIAGARLKHRPGWTIERLDSPEQRLAALAGDDGVGGVAQAFEMSFRYLPPDQQRFFGLLNVMPGPDLDTYAAAAVGGVSPTEADRLLDALVDAGLLLTPTPGRFRFHDLLRGYAQQVGDDEGADRLVSYYLYAVDTASYKLFRRHQVAIDEIHQHPHCPSFDDVDAALDFLDRERDNIVAVIEYAAESGRNGAAWQLAMLIAGYLHRRCFFDLGLGLFDLALAAAREDGNRDAQCDALLARGRFMQSMGNTPGAVELFKAALDIDPPDTALRVKTLTVLGLGLTYTCRYAEALDHLRQALPLTGELGDDELARRVLLNLGELTCYVGQYAESVAYLQRSVTLARSVGNAHGTLDALGRLGETYLALDRLPEAFKALNEGVEIAEEESDIADGGFALSLLGTAHQRAGSPAQAVACQRRALILAQRGQLALVESGHRLRLAGTYRAQGRWTYAERQYLQVLDMTDRSGDLHERALALDGLAHCEHATSRFADAQAHWQQALAILTEIGAPEADPIRDRLAG